MFMSFYDFMMQIKSTLNIYIQYNIHKTFLETKLVYFPRVFVTRVYVTSTKILQYAHLFIIAYVIFSHIT